MNKKEEHKLTKAEIASSGTYDELVWNVNAAIRILKSKRKNKVKVAVNLLERSIND